MLSATTSSAFCPEIKKARAEWLTHPDYKNNRAVRNLTALLICGLVIRLYLFRLAYRVAGLGLTSTGLLFQGVPIQRSKK